MFPDTKPGTPVGSIWMQQLFPPVETVLPSGELIKKKRNGVMVRLTGYATHRSVDPVDNTARPRGLWFLKGKRIYIPFRNIRSVKS